MKKKTVFLLACGLIAAGLLATDEIISPLAPQVGDSMVDLAKRSGAALNAIATNQNNFDFTILASASRTATTNAPALQNTIWRGVTAVFDITATNGGSPSLVLSIQGKDSVSGKYFTLLTGAAQTTTGTSTLTLYPGITVVTNVAWNAPLPLNWRAVVTAGTTDAVTYSVSGLMTQ